MQAAKTASAAKLCNDPQNELEPDLLSVFGSVHPQLPRAAMQSALLGLHRDLGRHGYRLGVETDIGRFSDQVRGVGKFVPTLFDPDTRPVADGDALGLVLRDPNGEVVGTNACRRVDLGSKPLLDHLATLRLFYDDPLEQMPSGEYVVIEDEAREVAKGIRGSFAWVGCFWVRGDHRGAVSNLSYILPTAARFLAANWWGPRPVISIVQAWLDAKRSRQRLGQPGVYPGVRWFRPLIDTPPDMFLMVTEATTAAERAESYANGETSAFIDTAALGVQPVSVEAVGG